MKHVDVFATRGTCAVYMPKSETGLPVSGWRLTRCTDNFSTVCPQKNSARRSSPVSHRCQRLWLLERLPAPHSRIRIHLYSVAENGDVAHHGPPVDPAEGTVEVVV